MPKYSQDHDVTLSGNTAGALTIISSGTMTLAGGNNITLSQAGNAVTISGAAAAGAQTAISGISASDTLYTSGTVRITGVGGGVTVSSNTGQRIDISVAAQSVQPETQTFIGGISASDTLYTSGNVRISGSQAATVRSGTGQLVIIDVPVQSTQVETQTFIAGVSASDTLYTSGNVRITGVGGGITVSSNTGQRIDLSVAAQSVQPETQTFISGISASDTLYTSGQVRITGVGGGVTVSSNTGQRIDISVAAPAAAQTGISGIANSQTTYTSGTVSLSELGAITIRSTTGNQYQLSVNSQSVQTQGGFVSMGVSTGGNTAGNTQVSTGSRFVIVASGNLTASQATAAGASTVTLSVAAQSVQPETQTFLAGIQNSQTTYTSGTVNLSVVAGNLTIRSTTGQAFQFSMSQTVQAETQTAISGIANSQTTYTSGTVSLSELGAITIRSTTGNQFQFSVNSQTVQTQNLHNVTLSGNSTSAGAGYIQISSGTLTLAGGNNVTLSQNGNAVTISAGGGAETQTAISGIANSQTTYTSGTVSLSELGAITIRSTTGNQFQFSVNSQTNQTGTIYAVSNTSGTSSGTYDARTLSIAGAGIVTVAASNSGWRIDASTAAQTNQSGNVYASSNTFGTSSGTYDARSISIAGRGAVSVAASNSGWIISAPVQSVQVETQSAISGIANSQTTYTTGTVSLSELGAITIRSTTGNQFQFSVNSQTVQTQGILNVALSNIGNTSGDTGINSGTRMVLAGGNNITLSASTAAGATTITISAPNLGAGAMSAGASNLGNTAGSTGITGTQLVFVGTNMISLSQSTGANGGTLSINATQSVQTQGVPLMGVSTGGATSGDTTVNSGTRFVLVGTNITMSQGTAANATTVTVSAPATSSLSATGGVQISTNGSTISIGYKDTQADWENFPMGNGALMTHISAISKTPFYWPEHLDGYLTAKSLAFKGSMVTANTLLSMSVHLGVYTHVNSTSAALLGSHSEAYVVSSATSVSLSGVRNFIMTGIGTHATLSSLSGGQYIFGMMFSAAATQSMNMSLYGASTAGGPLGGIYPGTNVVSAGTSQGVQALAGRGSTTVNAMPANIQASEIVNYGSGASMQLHPWIYIRS